MLLCYNFPNGQAAFLTELGFTGRMWFNLSGENPLHAEQFVLLCFEVPQVLHKCILIQGKNWPFVGAGLCISLLEPEFLQHVLVKVSKSYAMCTGLMMLLC